MTVSRVLNQPNKVADSTRERVEAALDDLGYVPNLAANTLRRERSGVIVAMVPTIESSVFSDTIQGISDVLEASGYQLLLGCTSYNLEKEEKLTKAFLGRRPDGVILTGTLHTSETRKLLQNAGIPVVEMWDITDQHIDMAVGFDNFRAGYEIASYMIQCGYTNIGYVAGSPDHEANENRAAKRSAGIYSAFKDKNISDPRRQNVDHPLDYTECGFIAADFVVKNPDIDAIICANEIIGVGAMKELQQRRWSIPEQIGIAGIGDATVASLIYPGLTTVRIPGGEIGKRSAEMVLNGLTNPDAHQGRDDIGFEIVARGSTTNNAAE